MVTRLSSTSVTGSLIHSLALARIRGAGLVLAGTLPLILIGQITIPLSFTPVPITMGIFATLGVGAVLGLRRGTLSTLLPGVLAAVGAPVLAGWSGGTVVTFGCVTGYILIAAITGRVAAVQSCHSGPTAVRAATGVALMLLVSASAYIPGLIRLKVVTDAGWGTTLYLDLVPFIVGDILKSVVVTDLLPARSRFR